CRLHIRASVRRLFFDPRPIKIGKRAFSVVRRAKQLQVTSARLRLRLLLLRRTIPCHSDDWHHPLHCTTPEKPRALTRLLLPLQNYY
ncbi:hypothetical protein HRR83_003782, partial [Exophiala dermatitidis]